MIESTSGSKALAMTAVVVALALAGCGETSTSGTRGSGGGGSSGAGGGSGTGGIVPPPPPPAVDRTCRDWCANEPEGFSCHQGPVESVQACYEDCLEDYQREVGIQCGDEWIAIKDCEVDIECKDLFGDCDATAEAFDECVRLSANRDYCRTSCPDFDLAECEDDTTECADFAAANGYCEAQCPTQDRAQCIEQRTLTGTCDYAAATDSCRQFCSRQDLSACVEQWRSTGRCDFDSGVAACQGFCPSVGAPLDYCAEYWETTGMCPDGPPPPMTCVEASSMCSSGAIDPIDVTCSLADPPTQANGCNGSESIVNPASCTQTGSSVVHQLTLMQIHQNCNAGYDLDSCNGNSCSLGGLAPGEGVGGVDNALAGMAPILAGVGGNLGGVEQAFHDGICAGDIDIQFAINTNAAENCAIVQIRDGGALVDTVILNRSNTGCLSGTLGTLPLNIAGIPGTLENAIVRMTVSSTGFSDGILGATVDQGTAGTIMDVLIDGGSAVVAQVLDINEDLVGDSSVGCNALSTTLEIGGTATP